MLVYSKYLLVSTLLELINNIFFYRYRFTSIAIDPQIQSIDGKFYDVLYIGTDNGKLLKAVYKSSADKNVDGIVISRSQVLPPGMPINALKVVKSKNKVIIISKNQVRSVKLNHCLSILSCADCVTLQDPHCAWDLTENRCVQTNSLMIHNDNYLQSISEGLLLLNLSKCTSQTVRPKSKSLEPTQHQKAILSAIGEQDIKKVEEQLTFNVLTDNNILPSLNDGKS